MVLRYYVELSTKLLSKRTSTSLYRTFLLMHHLDLNHGPRGTYHDTYGPYHP
jgi:hypothetical protein